METLTLDFFKIFLKYYFILYIINIIFHDLLKLILKEKQSVYMFQTMPFGIINSLLTKNYLNKIINSFTYILFLIPYFSIKDSYDMIINHFNKNKNILSKKSLFDFYILDTYTLSEKNKEELSYVLTSVNFSFKEKYLINLLNEYIKLIFKLEKNLKLNQSNNIKNYKLLDSCLVNMLSLKLKEILNIDNMLAIEKINNILLDEVKTLISNKKIKIKNSELVIINYNLILKIDNRNLSFDEKLKEYELSLKYNN